MTTEQQKQQLRERILALISLIYVGSFLVLCWLAWLGRIPFIEAVYYGSTALALLVTFYIMLRTHFNLRLHEQSLGLPQVACALILQTLFALRLPGVLWVFTLNTVALMMFAALQFSTRRYVLVWLLTLTASAVVTLNTLVEKKTSLDTIQVIDTVVPWLYFVIVLAGFSLICARISYLRNVVRERNRNMSATLSRYRQLLSHDELTHALSRRFFMEVLSQQIAQAERFGGHFCVAMLDLDHFKRINDRFGHPVGDAVLLAVCEAAWATLRQIDQVGRYGGEEFAILLPQCSLEDALIVLERVRQNVERTSLEHLAEGLQTTVSIGITEYRRNDNIAELLERADQAMYTAKQEGRNQIKTQ